MQPKSPEKKFIAAIAGSKKTPTFATAIERDSNDKMKFWCVSSVGQNTCLSRMGSRVRVPYAPQNLEIKL